MSAQPAQVAAAQPAAATPAPQLTDEQLLILALLADGHTHTAIGRRIGHTKTNTQNKLSRIYKRIGARSAAHAVAIAYRTGTLPVPNPGAHQQ